VQPLAIAPLEIGGTLVVHLKRKTALGISPVRFFSDSNRIYAMKSFAISMKCIIFVNQMITIMNSHLISMRLHLIASWWLSFGKT
jgi:hypothetical protein